MSRRHSNAAHSHHRATDPDVWVSVPRAATILSVHRNTIYNLIAQGKLASDHIAGRLVVRKASLLEVQKQREVA